MSKASLYINPKGYGVTRHSYSGSQEFNECARKYQLHRQAGWQEREQSAAMKFGTAVEESITEFHRHTAPANGLTSALCAFKDKWIPYRSDADLSYSKKHKDWDNLFFVGQDMIRLYAIKYPHFPYVISNPENSFQVNLPREIFPGTDLAGIELTSYIDIIAKLKPGSSDPAVHDDRVILDCKVSSAHCPQLVSLDPQLRTYSWVTGIPTVGFLWFEICSREVGIGDEVVMLEPVVDFKPGQRVWILSEDFNLIPLSPASVYVTQWATEVIALKDIKGQKKEDKAARIEYIKKHGVPVPLNSLTTQSIEVRTATVSEEGRQEIKQSVESDIVRIVHANETDNWIPNYGVRWPHDQCTRCCMRGICSNDDSLRDELITRDLTGADVL